MFTKEPAVVIGAIMALLLLLIGFGVKISGQQVDLIRLFLESLAPLVAGIAIRTQVTPTIVANQQIQEGIDAPKGTTTVEKVIEKVKEQNATN